jgi:hypothetical protein
VNSCEALGKIAKHSLAIAAIAPKSPQNPDELKGIASARGIAARQSRRAIDAKRGGANLASATKLFVLNATRRLP